MGFAFVWLFVALGLFAGSAKGGAGALLTMMINEINAVGALVHGPAAEALLAQPASFYVSPSLLCTAAILAASALVAVACSRRG